MTREKMVPRRAIVSIAIAMFAGVLSLCAQEHPSVSITGRVLDDSTGSPIVNANVFIANTMIGASSDTTGHFEIKNIPSGSHELVASCVGYNMRTKRIELSVGIDTVLDIRLKPRLVSLDIVEVTAPRSEEWRADLERFTRLLLGSTPEADQCSILNPEVLSFFRDDHGNFVARADSRLVVDNDALGYRLNLSLGEFRAEKRWIYTDWKVRFEDLLPSRPEDRSVLEQKRDDAYFGSLRHFLVALTHRRLAKDGFILYQTPTPARQRLDRVLELSEDDISTPSGPWTRTLRFSAYLVVEYDRTRVETFSCRMRVKVSMLSIEKDSVRVDSRGQILDPFALGVRGDWAKEKLALQLPLEFHPSSSR